MKAWKSIVAALACGLLPLGYTSQCAAADNGQIVLKDNGFGGESGKKAADATWDFFDQHLKQ